MGKFFKICFLFTLLISLSSCGQVQVSKVVNEQAESSQIEPEATQDLTAETQTIASPEIIPEPKPEKPLPATFDIDVAFASQAPFANWGLPYQEACEEASLIMVRKYFAKEPLDKKIMDNEIKKVVDWQLEELGYYTDTTLDEIAYVATEYYDLDVEISEDVSIENIKRQIFDGYLVVAPASGRDLDNPNFIAPGPIFHMLVIRGYDRNEFITNDPGTRKGLKFKYKYKNLIDSIHDLMVEDGIVFRPYEQKNVSDSVKLKKMRAGPKRMLIVKGLNN